MSVARRAWIVSLFAFSCWGEQARNTDTTKPTERAADPACLPVRSGVRIEMHAASGERACADPDGDDAMTYGTASGSDGQSYSDRPWSIDGVIEYVCEPYVNAVSGVAARCPCGVEHEPITRRARCAPHSMPPATESVANQSWPRG
jgi:hypothetical protein